MKYFGTFPALFIELFTRRGIFLVTRGRVKKVSSLGDFIQRRMTSKFLKMAKKSNKSSLCLTLTTPYEVNNLQFYLFLSFCL